MNPSHGLQLFTNCPSMGPFHGVQSFRNRLLQHGSPRGHKPCQQTCCSMGSSLHGSVGPGRSLLQCGLPAGCRWISAPPWTSMGCRGTACLTRVFSTSCRGKLSALAPVAPPPCSYFTDLGVCRAVSLTSSHSSLLSAVLLQLFFFPLLKHVITEALLPSLIALALASSRSVLELAGTGSIRHGGSFLQNPSL